MTTTDLNPTERAARIAELTREALTAAVIANRNITEALKLAGLDYDHNADRLRDISGTFSLATGALSQEHCTWDSYARERKRQSTAR